MAATLDKDTVVKHSFWILAGCYVVLVLFCLGVLMTSVSATVQDEEAKLEKAKKTVTDIKDPKAHELSKGAKEWQLLLQIDTDESIGMRWGDAGMIYYWMRASDLQKCDFDDAWLVLQSD